VSLSWLRGIDAVVYKETLHALRDPSTLILALFIPFVQLIFFGYVFDTKVEHVKTIVYDEDFGRSAIAFSDALEASRTFSVTARAGRRSDLRAALQAGTAHVGVDIPPNFTADLNAGRKPAVQILIDGSDAQVAQEAYSAAAQIGAGFGVEPPLRVDVRPRVLYNPGLRGADFYVPGLIGVILQNITMMLTALAIVGERERGTLDMLRATPIAPAALLLGKILPYAFIGMFDFASVAVAMHAVFAVPIAGSPFTLALAAGCFVVVALALGILISTFAATQMDALLRSFSILLPSIMLSGFFVDRELMNPFLKAVGLAIPLTYFLEVLRGIVLRGATFADLWRPIVGMGALGAVLFTIATIRFSTRPQA
jgi:ABC-type multidrug transport system permease subunit